MGVYAPPPTLPNPNTVSVQASSQANPGALGLNRQVFFCSIGDFDTHSDQIATQQTLFSQLSPAMNAFYNSTVELGLAQQVTSFTMSDFGRTFQPASGGGTDHGWGSVQMIMGGAVKSGDIYGTLPTFAPGRPG